MYRIFSVLILLQLALAAQAGIWRDLGDEAGEFLFGGQLEGRVRLEEERNAPLILVACRQVSPEIMQVVAQTAVHPGGRFRLELSPGTYLVGAFLDTNRDGLRQASEPLIWYGFPTPVRIGMRARRRIEFSFASEKIQTRRNGGPRLWPPRRHHENIGRIVTLDNPVFSRVMGRIGLWRPNMYARFVGTGLYWLEPYDPEKIPLLLIHGANGGPGDWLPVLKHLDRQHFAPWFHAYPSGMRLAAVSDELVRALAYLVARYDVPKLAIVAHSMGGLVARSFVLKWRQRYPEQANRIVYVMTVNTPFGGMDSARLGVQRSPVIVPSWKDVATGSRFLQALASAEWPPEVFWDVVYGYQDDADSDGVVPLSSQLPPFVRAGANHLAGFQATHAGILSEPAFLDYLNRRLQPLVEKSPDP